MRDSRYWLLIAAFFGTVYLMWNALAPAAASGKGRSESGQSLPLGNGHVVPSPNPAVFTRDPFNQQAATAATPAAFADWKLQGIVVGSEGGFALLNGRRLRVGDTVEGFTVRAIERDHVVLEDEEDTVSVALAGAPSPAPATTTPAVSAVMTSSRRKVAIIEGQLVGEGESWNGLLLQEVRADGVTLTRGEEHFEVQVNRQTAAGVRARPAAGPAAGSR